MPQHDGPAVLQEHTASTPPGPPLLCLLLHPAAAAPPLLSQWLPQCVERSADWHWLRPAAVGGAAAPHTHLHHLHSSTRLQPIRLNIWEGVEVCAAKCPVMKASSWHARLQHKCLNNRLTRGVQQGFITKVSSYSSVSCAAAGSQEADLSMLPSAAQCGRCCLQPLCRPHAPTGTPYSWRAPGGPPTSGL